MRVLLALLLLPTAAAQLTIAPVDDPPTVTPPTGMVVADVTVIIDCMAALQWTGVLLDSTVTVALQTRPPDGVNVTGSNAITVSVEPCRTGAQTVEGTFPLSIGARPDVAAGRHAVGLEATASVQNSPMPVNGSDESSFNVTVGFFGSLEVRLMDLESNVVIVDPGASTTVRYGVRNVGNAPSTVALAVQAPTNFTRDGGAASGGPLEVARDVEAIFAVDIEAPSVDGQWNLDLTFTPSADTEGVPAARSLTVRTKGPLEKESPAAPLVVGCIALLAAATWRRGSAHAT